jgi:beta-glucosidase
MASRRAHIHVCCLLSSVAASPWPPSAYTRTAAIVAQLTTAEKVQLCSGMNAGYNQPGHAPGNDYVGYIAAIPRLGIPAIFMEDGPQGVGDNMANVSAFPSIMTASQAWDVSLMGRLGQAMGAEERGKGANVQLGPAVALVRVPWSGRNFEYISEDPYLNAALTPAIITGIQSNSILASVKHYIFNSQEYERQGGNGRTAYSAVVDERTALEMYVPPYAAAVAAGVGTVMCSFNRINGTYACANRKTLDGWLKGVMGFDGLVVSDWGAQHGTAEFALGGLDMEQEWASNATYYGDALLAAVQAGTVPASRLNDMARRVLLPMFALGLIDNPIDPAVANASSVVTSPAHDALARELAEKSLVLLRNEKRMLPLAKAPALNVYVVGDAANTIAGRGSGAVISPYVVTATEALTAVLGSGVLVFEDSSVNATQAAARAAAADLTIVVVAVLSGEGSDRKNLSLPFGIDELTAAVLAAQPNTVVVVRCPGACLMPWANSAPAVFNQLYGGQEAWTAIAEAIFGDINPGGKLTVSFPTSMEDTWLSSTLGQPVDPTRYPGVVRGSDDFLSASYDEGLLVGYRHYAAANATPLFHFGHGLSYSRFTLSGLTVIGSVAATSNATVTARIDNAAGSPAGVEVVQLYLSQPVGPGEPVSGLKGFARLAVGSGGSATITLTLTAAECSSYSTAAGAFALWPAAQYGVALCVSAHDCPLHGTVSVN